ncbi:hypothetical protein SPAN111604_08610 [Sphingomonas antarctica]
MVTALFAVLLVFTGGSSRGDVSFLIIPRVGALVLIALLLIGLPPRQFAHAARMLAAGTIVAGLVALQLIPLPPSWWAALPGHAPYATLADQVAGARWRPMSLTPDLTTESLVALLPAIALGMAAAAATRRQRSWWAYAIVALASFSALLGLVQLADGPDSVMRWYPITNQASAVGIFANRNHNGVFLAAAIPIVAMFARERCRRLTRGQAPEPILFGAGVAIFGLAAMAVSTGSRFASIAAMIALIAVPIQFFANPRPVFAWRSSPRLRLALLAGTVATFALLAALVMLAGSGLGRIFNEGLGDDVRSSILPTLSQMTRDFLPFGSGYGSFSSVFRNYESFDQLRLTYLNAAHNDLFQLAIEGGLPGLALLIGYIVAIVRGTINAWRTGGSDLSRAASIGIWLLLAASLFDYPLRTPLLSSLLAVLTVWLLTTAPEDDALPRDAHNLGARGRGA